MKEELNKELKKQKTIVILEVLGLVASVILAIYLYSQNDNSFWTWVAIIVLDIIELPMSIKKYKKLKAELQK